MKMEELWEQKWDRFKTNSRLYSEEGSGEFSPKLQKYLAQFGYDRPRYEEILRLRPINEYFSATGGIPDQMADKLMWPNRGWNTYDPILENLQTHDWRSFADRLRHIGGYVDRLSASGGNKEYFQWTFPLDQISEDQDDFIANIKKLADYYGYSMTCRDNFTFSELLFTFEPIESEDATEYICNECGGVVYHISPRGVVNLKTHEIDNDIIADTIEREGLRCKKGDTLVRNREGNLVHMEPYRNFPERIYVSAFNIDEDIQEGLEDVVRMKRLQWKDAAIFEIIISDVPYKFYKDTVTNSTHGLETAFFTYSSLPPKIINRIH